MYIKKSYKLTTMKHLFDFILESGLLTESNSEATQYAKKLSILAGKKGAGALKQYVSYLNEMLKDEKSRAFIEQVFSGEEGNLQFKFNVTDKVVTDLVPTQSEIDIVKSVGGDLMKPQFFEGIFKAHPANLGFPIIAFEGKGNETYIIDGHHRWSQVASYNPKNSMQCWIFVNKNLDWEDMLKTTQAAIANRMAELDKSSMPQNTVKPGQDIMHDFKDYDAFKSFIDNFIEKNNVNKEDVVKKIKEFGEDISFDELIDRTCNNLVDLKDNHQAPKGAPSRVEMPQTDKAGNSNDGEKNYSVKDSDSALFNLKNKKMPSKLTTGK